MTTTRSSPHLKTAVFLLLAMIVTVGSALGFQYIGGYLPCKLCLEQRFPYYAGIPLMALAVLAAAFRWPAALTRTLLALGGILMLIGLGLAVFHSGVEWKFWPGPTDCTAVSMSITTNAGNLLNDMNAIHPPACDTAALRVLGLSFAGWNAIASLILALIAFRGAKKAA
ncbi:disulfide bond formation protein B [Phyllobacterium calauticae]|jgi:disulfide bond formation protein DsbB|uniref:disulfide bond formation protein B n=1 Tax=Phyllobacterium calauticae TaxID=2817027 RepID=UPI001CBBC506|nr:disulfide bond formation protein B [Phyllobacterium calauticae]MBZ3693321.1 disulfide bond formation protein B [Phyllobacterium calauticae]